MMKRIRKGFTTFECQQKSQSLEVNFTIDRSLWLIVFTAGRSGPSGGREDQGHLRQHRRLGHVVVPSGVHHLQRGLLVRLPARGGRPPRVPHVVLRVQRRLKWKSHYYRWQSQSNRMMEFLSMKQNLFWISPSYSIRYTHYYIKSSTPPTRSRFFIPKYWEWSNAELHINTLTHTYTTINYSNNIIIIYCIHCWKFPKRTYNNMNTY